MIEATNAGVCGFLASYIGDPTRQSCPLRPLLSKEVGAQRGQVDCLTTKAPTVTRRRRKEIRLETTGRIEVALAREENMGRSPTQYEAWGRALLPRARASRYTIAATLS